MDLGLQGRIALVTGGGKGIGAAIAAELGSMGAKVVISYLSDEESAARTADAITGCVAVQADAGDPEQVRGLIADRGPFDVVVNNAGILRDRLLLRMTSDDWDAVLRTDLSASFHVIKAAIPGMMKRRWGRIVNVSSIVGIGGNPGQANYSAAKAGLIGLTKSVAKEIGSRGITCNAIAPGYVRTELTSASMTDEMVARLVEMTPLRREGTASEVAAAAAFLCSPSAGFITGQVLVVDGGLST